jgi:hypothetical protein
VENSPKDLHSVMWSVPAHDHNRINRAKHGFGTTILGKHDASSSHVRLASTDISPHGEKVAFSAVCSSLLRNAHKSAGLRGGLVNLQHGDLLCSKHCNVGGGGRAKLDSLGASPDCPVQKEGPS